MPKRNKKNFRPTKSGAGMTEAGVRHTEERTPAVNYKRRLPKKVLRANERHGENLSVLVQQVK